MQRLKTVAPYAFILALAIATNVAMRLAPRSWEWPIVGVHFVLLVGTIGPWLFIVRRQTKRMAAIDPVAVVCAVGQRHLSRERAVAMLAGDVPVDEVPAGLRAGVGQ